MTNKYFTADLYFNAQNEICQKMTFFTTLGFSVPFPSEKIQQFGNHSHNVFNLLKRGSELKKLQGDKMMRTILGDITKEI
jgi:hypothetical protein